MAFAPGPMAVPVTPACLENLDLLACRRFEPETTVRRQGLDARMLGFPTTWDSSFLPPLEPEAKTAWFVQVLVV